MKAFFLLDELNQFHWAMLKSVLLILSLLPVCEGALNLWQTAEGSSQIVIGFFVISLLSTWFIVCFLSALKTSIWNISFCNYNVFNNEYPSPHFFMAE